MNENLVQEYGILLTQYDDVVRERDAARARVQSLKGREETLLIAVTDTQSENKELHAKVAELEKSLAYEKENATILLAGAVDIQNDLANARTAAQLAATHREASDKLIRDCVTILDNETTFDFDRFMFLADDVVKRGKELLGEVQV